MRLEKLEKDHKLQQTSLQKINRERIEAEDENEQNKLYIRKLESKIAVGRGETLAGLNNQKEIKISQLEQDKKYLEGQVTTSHRKIDKLSEQWHIYKRAIDLKAEEFDYGKGDLKSQVFYELSETQIKLEQAAESLQEVIDEKKDLRSQLDTSLTKIEELLIIKDQLTDDLIKAENEGNDLTGRLNSFQATQRNEEEEKTSLIQLVQELQSQNSTLEEDKAILEGELAANHRAAFSKTQQLEMDYEMQVSRLEEVQGKYEQTLEIIQNVEAELADKNSQFTHVSLEYEKVHSRLTTQEMLLTEAKNEEEENRAQIRYLKEQIYEQEGQLREKQVEIDSSKNEMDLLNVTRDETENLLKERMEKSLVEIQDLVDENDQIKESMEEAVSKWATNMMTQKKVECENQRLSQQVKNLINSKQLVEKTYTDQISVMKQQMDRLKDENYALRETHRR